MTRTRPTPATRRTVLTGAAAGTGIGALVPIANALGAEPRHRPRRKLERPNVIVVSIDDLGWDELGCYGNTFNETPRIDRLAKEGLRFTQAYAAAPLCSPTRAALVTGRHPGRTGITDYLRGEAAASDLHLSTDIPAIPAVLRPRGYTTGLIGKWHLTETYSGPYRQRPGNPYAHGFDEVIASEQLYIAGGDYFHPYFFMPTLPAREPGEYLTDRLAQEAVDYVRRHRHQPFFLHLSNYAVHTSLDAKPELVAKYRAKPGAGEPGRRPELAAMLESVDQQVGRIADTLEALGIARNTLLLVTSDNGGPNRPANLPLRGGKGDLYEAGIRVPLIAHWPGTTPADEVTDALTSTIDVLPTAAALAGTRAPQGVDGTSIAPVLRGRGGTGRDTLFWAYPHHIGASHPQAAVRQGRFKLLRHLRDGTDELYDLGADPSESTDISRDDPARTTRLARLLDRHLATLDLFAPPPGADAYPRVAVEERFTTGLASYDVSAVPAVGPAPEVAIVAGRLGITATEPSQVLLRTKAAIDSGHFALTLYPEAFSGAAGQDTVHIGVAQDGDNHVLLRYNHWLRRVGWDLRVDGRKVDAGAEPLASIDKTVDLSRPGARYALSFRDTQATAYVDQGKGWETLFRFDVGGVFDFSRRAVRERFGYAVGARLDSGTISIAGLDARFV